MSSVPENDNPDQLEDDDVFTPTVHPDEAFSLVYGDTTAPAVWLLLDLGDAQIVAACQPADTAIYCIDQRLLKTLDDELEVVEDKDVLIFPNGDAASEHNVYTRLSTLGRACDDDGAASTKYVQLASPLASYLGNRDAAKQAKRLERLVSRAAAKPARQKPKAPTAAQTETAAKVAELQEAGEATKRPLVNVNDDRLTVVNQLIAALQNGVHGDRLFNMGGELTHVITDEDSVTTAEMVDDRMMVNLLSQSAHTVSQTTRGVNSAWPESKTISAIYGCYGRFRKLRGIAPAPIVRADNTIAQEEGYDEASKVLLDLAGMEVNIPEDPTQDEVAEAVHLLLNEWLGDFPFATEADKANALALVLTYPLRELVTTVPLAVISAKSKGTGKSKFLGLVVQLFTRATPVWDSLPDTEEETRKQITTLLSTGSPFLCFDECPEIGGKSINRLLTAQTWSDRRLGGNERVSLPNRAVMAATGNNVQVLGDTGRRYYPIEMFYDGANPENRPESDFQHPDVEAWTEEHRGELLTAVFTLIRAWQVAGRPKKSTSFGSFERWEAVVGGVLQNAGVAQFLANLSVHRESSDYDEELWLAHLDWLSLKFPSGVFTSSGVVAAMVKRGNKGPEVDLDADLPPSISVSPLDTLYARHLGGLYTKRCDAWYGDGRYRLHRSPVKTGNKTHWSIEISDRVRQDRRDEAQAQLAQMKASKAARAAAGEQTEWPQQQMQDWSQGKDIVDSADDSPTDAGQEG